MAVKPSLLIAGTGGIATIVCAMVALLADLPQASGTLRTAQCFFSPCAPVEEKGPVKLPVNNACNFNTLSFSSNIGRIVSGPGSRDVTKNDIIQLRIFGCKSETEEFAVVPDGYPTWFQFDFPGSVYGNKLKVSFAFMTFNSVFDRYLANYCTIDGTRESRTDFRGTLKCFCPRDVCPNGPTEPIEQEATFTLHERRMEGFDSPWVDRP